MSKRLLFMLIVVAAVLAITMPAQSQDPATPPVSFELNEWSFFYQSYWSPDSTRVLGLSMAAAGYYADIFAAATGEKLVALQVGPDEFGFYHAEWSADGATVTLTDGLEDWVFDSTTGALIEKQPHEVFGFPVFEYGDSDRLIWRHERTFVTIEPTANDGQDQVLYDNRTATELARLPVIRYSPNDLSVVAPQWNVTGERVIMQNGVWVDATGEQLLLIGTPIIQIKWLSDGDRVAVLSNAPYTLDIWHAPSGQWVNSIPVEGIDFTFSPDLSKVAVMHDWGWVSVFDVTTGELIAQIEHFNYIQAGAGSYVLPNWSPDSTRLATMIGPDANFILHLGRPAWVGDEYTETTLTLYPQPSTAETPLVTLPYNTPLTLLGAPITTGEGRWWEVEAATGERGWGLQAVDGVSQITRRSPLDGEAYNFGKATVFIWPIP